MTTRNTIVGALLSSTALLGGGCAPAPVPPPPGFTACESLNTLALGARAVVGVPPVNSFLAAHDGHLAFAPSRMPTVT